MDCLRPGKMGVFVRLDRLKPHGALYCLMPYGGAGFTAHPGGTCAVMVLICTYFKNSLMIQESFKAQIV